MPPKFRFTRDEIIAAALNITRENGISAVTAREIAKRLDSSSKVIFGLFEDMNAVHDSVISAAKTLYDSYIEKGLQSELPFRGVGEQYILFAVNEPKLFQLLFMSEKGSVPTLSGILPMIDDNYEKILSSICEDKRVNRQYAQLLYKHLWIYTHGIASLCATKMCRFTAEEICSLMSDIYLGLLERFREGKND